MFLKKTHLDKSKIHGIGLFASEDILSGEKIWIPSELFTLHISAEECETLHPSDKEMVNHYGYFHKEMKMWHFSGDNSRFINHSNSPNIVRTKDGDGVQALRDIRENEELLQDYTDFEDVSDSARGIT